MFKNWKSLFSFLLFSLFLFPSFFFLPSPSHSSLVAPDSRSYPSIDKWTSQQKQTTLSILQRNGVSWVTIVAFGLKKLEFKSSGKDVVFHFDKLATTFQSEILKQETLPLNPNFDLTQILGEARKQLLQVYKPGKTSPVDGFDAAFTSIWNDYLKSSLNFLRLPLLKMKALGLSQIDVSYASQHDISSMTTKHENLENVSADTFFHGLSSVGDDFLRFITLALSPTPNNAKNVLDNAINKIWTPWLQTLQSAKAFGLTHLAIDKVQVDVSSLVNSEVQEASELSLEKIKILKKLQPLGLSKLQTQIQVWIDTETTNRITIFQKNWDAEKASTYLLWLPVFDIEEVKLSQKQIFPVTALATAIKNMLLAEKFDFIKLEGKAREELFNLLNVQGKLKQEKTFQDDVWRQIKNNSKWKAVGGIEGEVSLLLIRTLLFKVQELGINQVSHPFFPEGYDLSFLKDNSDWKTISFKNLLGGMMIKKNETNVEFYSHLFPNKVVFQVPMKKLDTIFSEITITNIIKNLELAITNSSKAKTKSETSKTKLETKNKGLIIGLSVGGGVLALSTLGGFLYWFFKIKK